MEEKGLLFGGSLMHSDSERTPDFSGYATKAGLKCSDGRTIMPDAFKHQDQATVPLVWQHAHNEPSNVLGHAMLENRADGVYAYGYFNDTDQAKNAKTLVEHGDIVSLSIYANQLVEKAASVLHGMIREVSLVLSGANPGALIDNVQLAHGDGETVELEDEAVIYTGLELELEHASGDNTGGDGPTVQDVYDSMTEEQKNVVNYMVGAALEEAKANSMSQSSTSDDKSEQTITHTEKEGIKRMSRNVFEQQGASPAEKKHVLTHDAVRGIVQDAVKMGSLKEAVEGYALKHGIDNIDILFPDAKTITSTPEFDKRRTEWVASVINGTRHTPFSRIKSIMADITHDEARARGYIKGTLKKEEFFGLTRRITTPTTVYKKQKLDRDDIIDITDLDVVAWLKSEMRLMLDEELARAVLIGDGRDVADEDKIRDPAGANEGAGIRSIMNDDDLYAATLTLDFNGDPADLVDAVLTGMQNYKGSGSPTLYTTLPTLTKMLLARDAMTNRRMYRTASDLASELGVANIVTVEVMESEPDLIGIIVNLQDYTIGADRGGEISMFDDFDIDYNQYKYLIETRVSGALTKIRSALVLVKAAAGATVLAQPTAPTFNDATGDIVVPTTANVTYRRSDTNADVSGTTVNIAEGDSLTIYATAATGYYFPDNVHDEWSFTNEPGV